MSKLLYSATEYGDLDCVVALSKVSHVDPNWKGSFGWTALHEACFKNNAKIMKFLLGWNKTDPNARENHGRTALFMACECRQLNIVSVILSDPRVDVNQTNDEGKTPLWEACRRGHLSVVKRLLASGRIIYTKTIPYSNDTTAAEIARSEGHSVIADLIESFERNPGKVTNELRKELGLHGTFLFVLFFFRFFSFHPPLFHRPRHREAFRTGDLLLRWLLATKEK